MVLIRARSLQHMAEQLSQLPEEKRKVIVFVGKHPNEGTANLAVHHHEEWEKQGAATIVMPAAWTPHGFWKERVKQWRPWRWLDRITRISRPIQERIFRNALEKVPSEDEITGFLQKQGFDVPIVHLHSTLKETINGKPFKTHLSLHARQNETRIIAGEPIDNLGGLKDTFFDHPNALVVEYNRPTATPRRRPSVARNLGPYEKWTKSQFDGGTGPVFPMRHWGMGAGYLHNATISREAMNEYKEGHDQKFLELLKHLAQNGLKKENT